VEEGRGDFVCAVCCVLCAVCLWNDFINLKT
jgi:hypothetical protein